MTGQRPSHVRKLVHAPIFTPKGFLIRAAAVTIIFLIADVAGLRAYACILSGTSPTGQRVDAWAVALGCAYLLSYFGIVLAVPILTIAAGVFAVLLRWRRRANPLPLQRDVSP